MSRSLALLALAAGCTPEPRLSIEPSEPTTLDDLVAGPVDRATRFEWTVDGDPVDDLVGNVVPADRTERGQVWAVRASHGLTYREARVEIGNAPPSIAVRIAPDPTASGQDLRAVVDASDADGDPIEIAYAWTIDGQPGPTDDAIAGSLVRGGQRWAVTATASDGTDEAAATAEVVIGDSPPRVTSIRLEPAQPTSIDPITAVWKAQDQDGDPITATVRWEVGGIPVAEGEALDSSFFVRGDVVRAVVTPSDGLVEGAPLGSEEVVIGDAAPTANGAAVYPSELAEGVVASCSLTLPIDADGDEVSSTVRWFVNGNFVSIAPALTGVSFDKGDWIECEATPSDGIASGEPVLSDPVEVGDTPPIVGSVALDPVVPTAAGPVSAVLGGVYDIDGDPIETEIDWYVDGALVATADQLDGLIRGQTVQARARAWDGEQSSSLASAATAVGDAPPSIDDLALSPPTASASADLTALFTTSDADGDPVTTSVQWFANQGLVYTGNPLPAGTVTEGTVLRFEVTADDGYGPVSVGSPKTTVGP